jgi:hypothetical protein
MAQPIKTPASAATERIFSLTNHLKNSLNPADDIQKAKMSVPYKFQGWMGLDKNSVQGKMEWQLRHMCFRFAHSPLRLGMCNNRGPDILTDQLSRALPCILAVWDMKLWAQL